MGPREQAPILDIPNAKRKIKDTTFYQNMQLETTNTRGGK
jgi:hypothetical protein